MDRTRIWGSVAALGEFWPISADSSGKREHWDGVWFGIARGAGKELVPAPPPRLYKLGLPGVAHPAGPCGRRERAGSQLAWPLIPTAAAQYCISPDGLLPSCDRLRPPLLVPADPLRRFVRVAKVVRYLINWSKAASRISTKSPTSDTDA